PRGAEISAEEAWKQKLAERATWWSLQPPKFSAPPAVADPTWQAEPVDRFIFARLQRAGLSPAPPADLPVLARRLSFVLTGLPLAAHPGLAEESSYESLVDALLASPHFGERI